MSCTVTVDAPCRRTLNFEVERSRLAEAVELGVRDVANRVNFKGFRPGKAPLDMVRRTHGKAIEDEARRRLMSEAFTAALKEHDLHPVSEPEMNVAAFDSDPQGPLTFELAIEVAPDFELGTIEKIPVTVELPVVDDAAVEAELERFRKQLAEVEEAEEGAAIDDSSVLGVTITYTVDGEALEPRPDRTVLVQHDLVDGLKIEGSGKAFQAKGLGDTLDLSTELPPHFDPPSLAGKTAELSLTLDRHRRLVVPELDAEALKKAGVESVEELKQRLAEEMHAHVARLRDQQLDQGLEKALIEAHPFELPERFAAQAVERRVHEYAHRLMEERKLSSEEGHQTAEAERERIQALTQEALRASFIFSKIAREQNLSASMEEAETHVRTLAAMQQSDPDETLAAAHKEGWIADILAQLTQDKTRNWLRERADVTEEQQQLPD